MVLAPTCVPPRGKSLSSPPLTGACRVPWGALFSHWRAGFSTRPGGFVDSGASPRIIRTDHRRPAEETGSLEGRRRRSNRPGTSQAKGPQVDGTLESGRLERRPTEGVRRQPPKSLRSRDRGGFHSRRTVRERSSMGPDEMCAAPASTQPLRRTPLYAQHVSRGAKMVPFAGYEMPVHYPLGILKEHLHTRGQAGLFDVSHMGQVCLIGPDHATTAAALERLLPADIANLRPGQQRYSQLLNDAGGIIDDLMVTRPASAADDGRLFLVVNAARKEVDCAHNAARLPAGVQLVPAAHGALLAVQR